MSIAAYRGARRAGGRARPPGAARRARREARRLRAAFRGGILVEELGTYALALDGDKRPCRVRASNAGHVLLGRHRRAGAGRRASPKR